MSRAAQREETAGSYLATGTEGASALREMAAERLAAHRSKRSVVEGRAAQAAVRLQARRDAVGESLQGEGAASRVRDAVAARYLQSQSYREFLAVEAQRALEQAQAEAEVAARNALAVAEAQRQLLQEIEQWNAPSDEVETPVLAVVPARVRKVRGREGAESAAPVRLEVRLHEELGPRVEAAYVPARVSEVAPEEMADLDEEIEFRMSPEFEELVLETQAIQANIIEFPRQLVASRKVRPRLAEGPLMEEIVPEPQLRIFEVEPELVAVEPEVMTGPDAPVWQSLRLGSGTAAQVRNGSQLDASDYFDHWLEPVVHVATVSRRAAAAAMDAVVVAAGLSGAAAVALKIAGESLRGGALPVLAGSAVGALVVFGAMYMLLFFTLSEATPGMRAARVAFCTFDEKSPTRGAVRRRMLATMLAVAPLGLGIVWAVLDGDRLGWQDRMSRMYLRKY